MSAGFSRPVASSGQQESRQAGCPSFITGWKPVLQLERAKWTVLPQRQKRMIANQRAANLLIVGDTPHFGRVVAAILGNGALGAARQRHTTYLLKPQGHG